MVDTSTDTGQLLGSLYTVSQHVDTLPLTGGCQCPSFTFGKADFREGEWHGLDFPEKKENVEGGDGSSPAI